jgi:hypothetical protein
MRQAATLVLLGCPRFGGDQAPTFPLGWKKNEEPPKTKFDMANRQVLVLDVREATQHGAGFTAAAALPISSAVIHRLARIRIAAGLTRSERTQ